MKYVFLAAFLVFAGLSALAYVMTPAPDASGRKVIVWASDDNPRRRNQIDEFNRLHPDHELQLDAVNSGIDKVITQSLAGVGPDVFDGFRNSVGLLLDAGLLYDVTDDLKAHGITLDQFWPLARPGMSVAGRIYGVPCNVSGNGVWYHRDIFDAEHIDYPPDNKPWAWDDFVATARKLTKRDEKGRVTRWGVMGIEWNDCVLSNGGRVFTPDGRRCVVDSPQAIEAVQRWIDLQRGKDPVMPTPVDETSMSTQGGWGTGIITLFQEKRVAMAGGGRWWLCTLRDVKGDDGKFPFNLGVARKPFMKFERIGGGARVAYVNALSPHRDRAIQFLLYLCGAEYSDQLNRDADALPGIEKMSDRPAFDYDPNHGRDGGNSPVWKFACNNAVNTELSPYITPQEVDTYIDLQIDLMRGGQKGVAEGLRQAAADVNAQIAKNCSRDPELKKHFENGDESPVLDNFPDAAPSAQPSSQGVFTGSQLAESRHPEGSGSDLRDLERGRLLDSGDSSRRFRSPRNDVTTASTGGAR